MLPVSRCILVLLTFMTHLTRLWQKAVKDGIRSKVHMGMNHCVIAHCTLNIKNKTGVSVVTHLI